MFKISDDDIKKHLDIRKSIEYINSGNLRKAFKLAKTFARNNPELTSAHILESGIAEALKLPDLVLKACKKAISLDNYRNDIYMRGIFACLHLNDETSASDLFAGITPRVLETGTDLQQLWMMYQYAAQAFEPLTDQVKIKSADISDNPLVSVIIPTANRHLLLIDALTSLINQTHHNWEAIVVNARAESVENLPTDKRIKLINSRTNINAAQARNLGISEIKGEFFCFLDDDDLFKPNHLSMALSTIRDKNSVGIFSDSDLVFEKIVDGIRSPYDRHLTQPGRRYSSLLMQMRNYIKFNEAVFRRDYCGHLRFDENLSLWEDWDYMLSIFSIGTLERVNASTCEVRRRPDDMAHMSMEAKGIKAACDYIFSKHPTSKPWLKLGRLVYMKIQKII